MKAISDTKRFCAAIELSNKLEEHTSRAMALTSSFLRIVPGISSRDSCEWEGAEELLYWASATRVLVIFPGRGPEGLLPRHTPTNPYPRIHTDCKETI